MDCFRKGNKTRREVNRRPQRRYTPRRPKVNGWSWPPHPFQILSWVAYLYFPVVVVGILIPLLPSRWVPAGYIWFGVAFIWHLAFHVIAATIDPAEDSVRAKGYERLPPVYKGKPLNLSLRKRYCPLCEVQVYRNSKHCNTCKKCVGYFDHHCKWLNNCIGGRNYRYFLSCVISAILGCLIIVTISGFVFVGFFINPKLLRSNPKFELVTETNTRLVFLPCFSVRTNVTVILCVAVVTIGLSLTALIALCDLLFFHFYLMWKRLSTYKYILFRREQQVSKFSLQNYIKALRWKSASSDLLVLRWKSSQNTGKVASHQNRNLHIHFENTSKNGSTSEYRQNAVIIEDESLRTVASNYSQDKIEKISQKKRRCKRSAGRSKHKAAINSTKRSFRPTQLPPARAAAFRSSMHSLQAFPSMDYLSSLPVSTVHTVQAAGPPAEYHSDSAESTKEIPVVQTRLSSAAVAMQTSTSFHSTEGSFGNSLQSAISIERPDQPTTSKKSKGLDRSIEQLYREPPVNDRHKNDEMPVPE